MGTKSGVLDRPPPRFKVGDRVAYRLWVDPPPVVEVIEYRGPLGQDGEHMYRLRRVLDWGEVKEFEQVESALQPAPEPAITNN